MSSRQTLWMVILAFGILLAVRMTFFTAETAQNKEAKLSDYVLKSDMELMDEYSLPKESIWLPLRGLEKGSEWKIPKTALPLEDSLILVKGYMYPFDKQQESTHFGFSALPLSMCYFCGRSGPESVMEIFTDSPITYSDKGVWLRGRLVLNRADSSHLAYQLHNAKLVSK